jgi:secreted trypsin-like serine protease
VIVILFIFFRFTSRCLLLGDAGGPIFQWNDDHWEQVGISSFTIDDCKQGSPVVYTRIAYYHDWIETYTMQTNDNSEQVSHFLSVTNNDDSEGEKKVYECDSTYSSCGCGNNPVRLSESRIINGETSFPYSWSMMVSIRFNGSEMHACGGTILSDSHILTSASCIADAPVFGISIVGGVFNYSEGLGTIRKVESIFIHPDYVRTLNNPINDIAILHLSSRLDFIADRYVTRTCLPQILNASQSSIEFPLESTPLVVIGWGYQYSTNQTFSHLLQQAEIYAANRGDGNCPILRSDHDLQFCAQGKRGSKG